MAPARQSTVPARRPPASRPPQPPSHAARSLDIAAPPPPSPHSPTNPTRRPTPPTLRRTRCIIDGAVCCNSYQAQQPLVRRPPHHPTRRCRRRHIPYNRLELLVVDKVGGPLGLRVHPPLEDLAPLHGGTRAAAAAAAAGQASATKSGRAVVGAPPHRPAGSIGKKPHYHHSARCGRYPPYPNVTGRPTDGDAPPPGSPLQKARGWETSPPRAPVQPATGGRVRHLLRLPTRANQQTVCRPTGTAANTSAAKGGG